MQDVSQCHQQGRGIAGAALVDAQIQLRVPDAVDVLVQG